MDEMLDLIIIGAGPAGLTAGLYAKRLGLNVVIFEKLIPGGQVLLTDRIENYPGFESGITGNDLAEHFLAAVKKLDIKIINKQAVRIEKNKNSFFVGHNKETHVAKAVIIATGASARNLGLPSEAKFLGKGISYCAICDGPLYRNKDVCVIGGGDKALEEAIYLSKICRLVYLIHRRDAFRAAKILQDEVHKNTKIKLVLNSVVSEFIGQNSINQIKVKDVKLNKEALLDINGAFIAVGINANTNFLGGLIEVDERGFIKTDAFLKTSLLGAFAAGDVCSKSLRQVVTAVADGAIAAFGVYQYLAAAG